MLKKSKKSENGKYHSAVACFARRQEYIIKSICCISMITVLENRSNQHSVRGGMLGALGNRYDAVKQLKKFKHKWKKELKTLKNSK